MAAASAVPTPPIVPPMASSNEANREQLALVRRQGEAEGHVLAQMREWITDNHEGMTAETRAGALRLVCTLTAPEGSWRFAGGKLAWQAAEGSSAGHLRVFAMDAGDGRLVPGLTIRATLLDAQGRAEAVTALPFAWYPLLNGYGANLPAMAPGSYTVALEIAPPTFHRHDPHNGYRFQTPIEAVMGPLAVDASPASAPPVTEREEQHLDAARPEAEALRATLANMYRTAIEGRDVRAGDYIVANANEYSEAYWEFEHGHFVLATEMENAAARNSHVEVAVMDALTGRFVPGLRVTASLTDARGRSLGSEAEPLMWHPWLWHYGENWRIPHNGLYTVHVHFEPPDFARYGRTAGNIMAEPVDLDFAGQKLISGEK